MGSEGDVLPDHVGIPMGENLENPAYFMVEIHYDNPRFDQDVSDNSGIRIVYTDKLRQYDSYTVAIFEFFTMLHAIPPLQEDFMTIGRCNSECSKLV